MWEAFQHQKQLYSRYNTPPWLPSGAVSGSSGALARLANHVSEPREFLHAHVNFSKNKLSFYFLLVLIKMLNEGATFFNRIFLLFLFGTAFYLDYLCWSYLKN